MNAELLRRMTMWRNETAAREGVEIFRVLPNAALAEIAKNEPKTKEELTAIKGIKEKKFAKYGEEILRIVSEATLSDADSDTQEGGREVSGPHVLSVGKFLDVVNANLAKCSARVRGEVSSVQERGRAMYFTIRDAGEQASLACFAWARDMAIYGVELREGMEVIVSGAPSVYKPYGKLSLQVAAVEPVGEGALKAAYDRLVAKLESEGLFDAARKRPLPEAPGRIGIITSREGAVIHDFLNNAGKNGYRFSFRDSRVEGQLAVKDLLAAIEAFRTSSIDALVVMRGGGSLESLQAFNNEAVVRALVELPFPVIAAIGHHRDAPIVTLAADMAVSTPTAAAQALNARWDMMRERAADARHRMAYAASAMIARRHRRLERSRMILERGMAKVSERFSRVSRAFGEAVSRHALHIENVSDVLDSSRQAIASGERRLLRDTEAKLSGLERTLRSYDPERRLRAGYALVRDASGQVVRNVARAREIGILGITVSDGTFEAQYVNTSSYAKKTRSQDE